MNIDLSPLNSAAILGQYQGELSTLNRKERECHARIKTNAAKGDLDDPKIQRLINDDRLVLIMIEERRPAVEALSAQAICDLSIACQRIASQWNDAVSDRIKSIEESFRAAIAPFCYKTRLAEICETTSLRDVDTLKRAVSHISATSVPDPIKCAEMLCAHIKRHATASGVTVKE